jgi:hypothetical protein
LVAGDRDEPARGLRRQRHKAPGDDEQARAAKPGSASSSTPSRTNAVAPDSSAAAKARRARAPGGYSARSSSIRGPSALAATMRAAQSCPPAAAINRTMSRPVSPRVWPDQGRKRRAGPHSSEIAPGDGSAGSATTSSGRPGASDDARVGRRRSRTATARMTAATSAAAGSTSRLIGRPNQSALS